MVETVTENEPEAISDNANALLLFQLSFSPLFKAFLKINEGLICQLKVNLDLKEGTTIYFPVLMYL